MTLSKTIALAISSAVVLAGPATATVASEPPNDPHGAAFTSAPELGSAEEILARSPQETSAILQRLPADRRAAVLEEAGASNAPSRSTETLPSDPDDEAAPATAGSNRKLANRLMFNQSLQYFINFRAWYHQKYPGLAWESDGCSVPFPLSGISSAYMKASQNPCVRHDFGYRNYGTKSKLKLSPTEAGRKVIDDKFLADMQGVAASAKPPATRDAYYVAAGAFYQAVRSFGGKYY